MGKKSGVVRRPRLSEAAYLVLGYVGTYSEGVHGYRLGRALSRSALGLPWLRLGQLYRLLEQLELQGLLVKRIDPNQSRLPRAIFSLSERGKRAFERWIEGPPRGSASIREQLMYRLRFSERLPASTVRRMVGEANRECAFELHALRSSRNDDEESVRDGSGLVSRAIEARLAADRRWLMEVENFVDSRESENGVAAVQVRGAN